MPVDAYWAVACIALAFCLALSLIYNLRALAESGKLKADVEDLIKSHADLLAESEA